MTPPTMIIEKNSPAMKSIPEPAPDDTRTLGDLGRQYLADQINLVKLNATERGALMAGKMALATLVLCIFLLLLLSGGAALVLATGTPEHYFLDGIGYAALVYVLIIGVLVAFRKRLIVEPLANYVIKMIYSEEN